MRISKIGKHFDQIAHRYDQYKERNRIYYLTLKKAVKQAIRGKDKNILDIGCGTGEILAYLHPVKGLGVDISKNMIKLAQKKYSQNKALSFRIHDIESSPIKGAFDYIIFTDVIEHLIDKEKAIKNISQTMNEKTILILSMANPWWEPLLLILEKLNLKMPEGPHKRIREKELVDILGRYQLRIFSKKVYLPKINLPFLNFIGLIHVYQIKRITLETNEQENR